ncbi:MAG: hypothetical protein ACK4LB_15645 [Spirosomataceae bacterium]
MKHFILLGLSLLLFRAGFAQQFPVDCRVLLSPPYSGMLADYTQSPSRLRIQLTLRDLSQPSLQVSLRVRLLGPGLVMGNSPDFIQSRPIILSPGIPTTLSGLDLVEHFSPLNWNIEGLYDPQNPLPPGRYEWEVVAVELFRDRQVSNVERAFWNWSSHLPPQLQSPLGDQSPAPGLLFSWRSRSFLPLNRAWYRLFLYELDEDDDPQFVSLSGAPPFRVIETGQTSYFYGPGEVPLTPGKRYAWRVQATDWQGETHFELDGWSEACAFRVLGPPCLAPKPTVYVQPPSAVELVWDPVPEVERYEIQVRKKENEVQTFSTDVPRWVLRQQNPGDYTFRVQSVCGIGRMSAWTSWQPYVIPEEEEEESWMSDPDLVYSVEPEPEPNIPDPIETAREDLTRILDEPFEFLIVPRDGECVGCEDTRCVVCEDTDHGDTDHGGASTVLHVLSEATTVEQLEAIVKPLKPQCIGVVSNFSCGTAEEIPIYSGEIISVKPGDEVMMNTLKLQIVEIDGQGNGIGTVKVPMMGMAKVGVKLVNLKVAEGGCVVDGYAETSSDVPLLVLDEKLKKNLKAIAVASQLVAEVGKTYARAIAEKINDFREGVDKIRAWAKGYQGGNADAGKAKAFQAYSQQAGKAMLENKAVPDSLKSALNAAQEKSKEAWTFFQTGKPCEVSGGGGGNHHKTFPVADCAGYAAAIEAEMVQLEQIRAVTTCDCNWIRQMMEASNHCEELGDRLAKIRAVNQTSDKVYTQFNKPSFGLNSWQSRYVKVDGQCYGIRLTPMFVEGVADLDFKRFKKDRATQTIQVLDGNEKNILEIKVLSGDWDKLDQYLGFHSKTTSVPGAGSSTEGKYITGKQLKSIFPSTSQRRCNEVAALINKYADKFEINTPLRLAHFIAQTGYETSGFRANKGAESGCYTSNNSSWSGWINKKSWSEPNFKLGCLGYISTKKGKKKLPWKSIADVPSRYICGSSNPKSIAERNFFSYVYQCEGDNGDEESMDGYKYRGHGWIQLTWKKQYVEFNEWMKLTTPDEFQDVVAKPDLIGLDKTIDAISGMWFWQTRGLNKTADKIEENSSLEEFKKLTRLINSAALGNQNRKELFEKTIESLKK